MPDKILSNADLENKLVRMRCPVESQLAGVLSILPVRFIFLKYLSEVAGTDAVDRIA